MRRSEFLTWHRRMALLFAPLLLLQGLTGAVLLFKEPLALISEPRASEGPALAVSALVAAASYQGQRVARLYPAGSPGASAIAHLAAEDGTTSYAAIDPASGAVLREGRIWAFPVEAALQWHYRLMWGTTGLAIVALNGGLLALLSGTGLAFWWPTAGRWKKALSINAKMPARIRLRQWHRSGGVVISLLVLFSAVTGILLAAPDLLPDGAAKTEAYSATPAQIDSAVAVAQKAYPDAAIRDIRFPPADRVDISFLAPEEKPLAVHVVQVRLSDARVLKVLPAAQNPVLWMKIMPLHTGESFGLVGLLLLLAEGLALAALSITGPLMWWQTRKYRK